MELIKRAWNGEEKLWKVFWLYNVLGGIVISFLVSLVPIIGILLCIIYFVWNTVSLWRCAWNASIKLWGYILRVLIIFCVLVIPLGIILGGMQKAKELITQAECRKEFQAKAQQQGTTLLEYMQQHADEFYKCTGKSHKLAESMTRLNDVMNKMNEEQPKIIKAFDDSEKAADKLEATLKEYEIEKQCVDFLHQYAIKNKLDPIDYEVRNQPWIKQCIKQTSNGGALKKN